MRILTVVGARPQFIKAAVVSRAIQETDSLEETIVHTGQHYDQRMSQVFFDELGVPAPTHSLEVGSAPHAIQTARLMERLHAVIDQDRPDTVLVYGDTNSTIAAALVASKMHVPVAHVEAGLRSFNQAMPEEINRVVTDHVSTHLFAPTLGAARRLQTEGLPESRIHHVGDVMYDATLLFRGQAQQALQSWTDLPEDFILATVHRAENTDDAVRLKTILRAIGQAADDAETVAVMPLHPRTQAAAEAFGGVANVAPQIHLIEPASYFEMMALESKSRVIVTDSGGVQKEAYFHGRPCVTVRTETEWTELVESGWNRLVDPRSEGSIRAGIADALARPAGQSITDYGKGDASTQICSILQDS